MRCDQKSDHVVGEDSASGHALTPKQRPSFGQLPSGSLGGRQMLCNSLFTCIPEAQEPLYQTTAASSSLPTDQPAQWNVVQ